jgi:hypothetical protein
MKTIFTYIRAFFSLGWLGLIIGLLALAILVAAFSQISDPFDAAIERMFVLNKLESSVALDLAEMQVQESQEFFTLSYGLDSSGAAQKAQQADERISLTLAGLEEDGRFYGDDAYITDQRQEVAAFNEFRATHRQNFENLLNAPEGMTDENWFDAFYMIEDDNETLNFMLRTIIIVVEQDRLSALDDFPDDANHSILIIALALAATLLLALLGYQAIAGAVRPLSRLRNTMSTIAGDVEHPSPPVTGGVALGLSQALAELARAEHARNQNAKQEVEDLRQALYESRRRRLKIYQPEHTAE